MARAPYQVLVFLYRRTISGEIEVAIFCRADTSVWQAISGGGEDGESTLETAQREVWEEVGIQKWAAYSQLNSVGKIPAKVFSQHVHWGAEINEIPEYSFGLDAQGCEVVLSAEHSAMQWVSVEVALAKLEFESNRRALRELAGQLSAG